MKYRTAIVDDDPLFREWLRSLLEGSRSFQLLGEACTGAECLVLLDKHDVDAVVLDVNMPDWDGLELAGYIRTRFPDVRIVVTSSHSDRVYSMLAQQKGAQAFIPKENISIASLLRALEAAPVP
jgi:DNA-binding NarL/FixJ family response regulator